MKPLNQQNADALAGRTILVVDDSEVSSLLICNALDARGYNLETVACGQEAFDWVQSVEPDLLLLDYKLPDFNGDVLIKRLSKQGRKIPFVIITGHGDEKIAVEMMRLGAIDYLVKDEVFLELLPVVVAQALQSLHNQQQLLYAEEELKIAEREALESRRQAETLIANVPGMVYRCLDDHARTMEFVSEGCRDLLGYQPGDLIGGRKVNYADLVHPNDRSMLWQQVQEAVKEGRPFTLEYRIRTAGGQEVWAWEQGRGVYGPDGVLEALEGLVIDITERKKLMAEQARSAQLAALGTVAAGVAHEINNPIQGIMNYATLIHGAPQKTGSVIDISLRIIKESERIASITKTMLEQTKNRSAAKVVSDIQGLVEDSLALIGPKVRRQGVVIDAKFAKNLPQLTVHPQGIQQVVINLVDNAYDALRVKEMPTVEKVITVTADLFGTEQTMYVCIEFYDRGVGMADGVLKRAKDTFFSTKPSAEGTGLGLSIVNDIIAGHEGRLDIESKEGEYTKVKAFLPVTTVS